MPMCCPCPQSEKELNIHYSNKSLNKVWKSSEALARSSCGSFSIPITGVLKTRLNNSPDGLHPVFLWSGEWVVSWWSALCQDSVAPKLSWGENLTVKIDAVLYGEVIMRDFWQENE